MTKHRALPRAIMVLTALGWLLAGLALAPKVRDMLDPPYYHCSDYVLTALANAGMTLYPGTCDPVLDRD